MNASELLKKDHDAVRQLFAQLESAESEQDQSDVYEDLREELMIHARIGVITESCGCDARMKKAAYPSA